MDDESGWHRVLVELWGPQVRGLVVARVEAAYAGRRARLVRALSGRARRDEDVEDLHAEVLAAIRAETGADLEALGSQAAWAAYDEAWAALAVGWAGGERLGRVALRAEPEALGLLAALTPAGAAAAGMDVDVDPPAALWCDGRLCVDGPGLRAYLTGHRTDGERRAAERLLRLLDDPA